MKMNRWRSSLLILTLGLCHLALAVDKPTYWGLTPKADDRLPNGKMVVVGGKTNPIGVHFHLKDLKIDQPVSIQVVSADPAKVLEIRAFKDTPAQPLVTKQTDEKGVAELHFRTNETMYFRLTSKEQELVDYQLAACVGPSLKPPAAEYFGGPKPEKAPAKKTDGQTAPEVTEGAGSEVTKKDDTEAAGKAETRAAAKTAQPDLTPAAATPPAGATVDQTSGFQTAVIALLALIFVALVVLVVVLLKKKSNTAAVILVATMLLLGQAAGAGAGEKTPLVNIQPLGPPPPPGLVSRENELDPNKDFIVRTNKAYNDIMAADAKVGNMVQHAQTLKQLLEYFDIIDGKEKLVVANFAPRGMPKLPSSYRADINPSANKTMKFNEINGKIQKAHEFLENNFVVLKQTLIETNRIKDLQKAAAGMSTYAQLALMIHGQEGPAEKAFYDKYDGAVLNGLDYLDKALKEMSEFEEAEYGFDNWYVYYGIHFYNFMLNRYTRK